MKTRVLLLAGFLVLGAACGNKDANGDKKQATAPNILPLPADQLEVGHERLSIREFLDERPRLERVVASTHPYLNGIDLKFRKLNTFTLHLYSNDQPAGYRFGTVQRMKGRLLLDPNQGSVRPFRNAQGEICAHVMLNPTRHMPAVTITACEENYVYNQDSDDRDDRRRRRR